MSLADLFAAPSPDGETGNATARADAIAVDPSLGGATRTNADSAGTLESLLVSVGRAVRTAAIGELANTPAGQAAIADAKAQYIQAQWQKFSPMLMIGLAVVVLIMFVMRK